VNPDEVHLVIVAVRYTFDGRTRKGVFSVQCAERLEPGDRVPIYVNTNPAFRMPPNPDAPIIMIGPGTGVAPFRAFLQEREQKNMRGKTWLFYGDRRFKTDFLYQVEWQQWLKTGALTSMDVAFSRDGRDKHYVQHRMLERGRDLFCWLEDGASVYVCGDEKSMAPDVNTALETIIAKEGGLSTEKAKDYLAHLRETNRYQRDVY
jgi:sulfite reductase (NADPH) flavoprotein alpha-component